MEKYSLKILELNSIKNRLCFMIRVKGPYNPSVKMPKIALVFSNGKETRRLPIINQSYFPDESLKEFTVFAKYTYSLTNLFYKTPFSKNVSVYFEVIYGENVIEKIPFTSSGDVKYNNSELYDISPTKDNKQLKLEYKGEIKEVTEFSNVKIFIKGCVKFVLDFILLLLTLVLLPLFILEGLLTLVGCAKRIQKLKNSGIRYVASHVLTRMNSFSRMKFGITNLKFNFVKTVSNFYRMMPIKTNRITFISNRRTELSGNFQFVYEIIKDDKSLDIKFIFEDRHIREMSFSNAFKYGKYCVSSKIVLVDDYVRLIHTIPKRDGIKIMQLWHACGAFKTFGFSRIGKPGSPKQAKMTHRHYDRAIVSSQEIAKFYAEGFGLSLDKVVATGIPRTDIFFEGNTYRDKVIKDFYEKYENLKDKKILLFAPTFRGSNKTTGNYPVEKFDVVKMYNELKGEYAIIIKHHPFVKDRNVIPDEYKDYIIDLSDNAELNDILFVTDLLVTDYSSVIFEAAIMSIPMLFFAFDLQKYISSRGFYYEYEKFVPGKIVTSFGQAVTAIKNNNLETEKIQKFKTRFFDHLDGKSSQRVADLIYKELKNNKD